ncbi:MAG: hypothetical protein MUF07_12185 [Steroidobacteraceae bacterium]|nr:hypothetical protein [Steroidobacteraceae bacterium]
MRTWTLAFLLACAAVTLILRGDAEVPAVLAGVAFIAAVLLALLAGVRRIALQMVAMETQVPRVSRATRLPDGRSPRRRTDVSPPRGAAACHGAPRPGAFERR